MSSATIGLTGWLQSLQSKFGSFVSVVDQLVLLPCSVPAQSDDVSQVRGTRTVSAQRLADLDGVRPELWELKERVTEQAGPPIPLAGHTAVVDDGALQIVEVVVHRLDPHVL